MSSRSDVSSTAFHLHNSGAATISPTAPIIGLASQDPPGDSLLAAQFCPPPLAKEYFNARFGPIIDGHYTEF
jgi:hypothetical protein